MQSTQITDLSEYRGIIVKHTTAINYVTLLERSDAEVYDDIHRIWYLPLITSGQNTVIASPTNDTWDIEKVDNTKLMRLFCYHGLFVLYGFLANDTDKPDAFTVQRDYWEKKYWEEFEVWKSVGFPYTEFDTDLIGSTGLQNFVTVRV